MADCSYCDASFEDEDARDAHLASEHADELGPIDRRRLNLEDTEVSGFDFETVALWIVVLVPIVVVGYVLFGGINSGGNPGGDGPYDLWSVHEHGTLEMVVDGQQVDFSQPQYQVSNTGVNAFHFENGQGRIWHVHARGVTLQWALDSLGIHVTTDTVRFEGTTYRDADPNTTVMVRVNGQPVVPANYVLDGVTQVSNAEQGDNVRIFVNRST